MGEPSKVKVKDHPALTPDQSAFETPLTELLREIPTWGRVKEVIDRFEDGTPCGHRLHPAGFLAHKAADEIDTLLAQNRELVECLDEFCGFIASGCAEAGTIDAYRPTLNKIEVKARYLIAKLGKG